MGKEPENRSLEILFGRLRSADETVRMQAVRQAQSLSSDQIQQLVRREGEEHRKARKQGHFLQGTLLVVYVALVCLLYFVGFKFVLLHVSLPFFAVITGITTQLARAPARLSLIELIASGNDVRLVPVVLNILGEGGQRGKSTYQLRTALKHLLPHTNASIVLNTSQRTTLHNLLLAPYEDIDLTLTILKALEQIGDESAITIVSRLCYEPAASDNMIRVREAAKECLPYLRTSRERLATAQTLLRPADTPTAPDTLLRPAHSTPDTTPQEELLRPTAQP